MTYEEIISKVADSTGFSKSLVDKTYKAYWRTVRDYLKSQPLKEDLTDEEFQKLKPNVNIPSLGKFYVTIGRYTSLKEKYNKDLKNK
jgi:hypothetical protein